MPKVAIVTDTTHYLPRELAAANGLHEVSLYVNWNGRTERESDMPDFDAYYEYLRTADELPTTSQPSIGDFLAVYEPLLAEGRDIVSIHLTSGVSGTYESACQAKAHLAEQGFGDRIEVLDSRTACAGHGMMALGAAAAVRKGGSLQEVVAHALETREHLKIWFAVDTLEYFKRGGRIGGARAWLGTTLKIKPILSIEEELTPVERVRTSGRAFERMVEYLRSRHADGADAWIINHIQAPDEAERLVERGREIFGTEPIAVSEIGPVIGTHAGPGLIGVGGVPAHLIA